MITNKNTCEAAIYFNKDQHEMSDFEFVIVEQILNSNTDNSVGKRLLTREAFWSAQFCTLTPHGLKKKIGVQFKE